MLFIFVIFLFSYAPKKGIDSRATDFSEQEIVIYSSIVKRYPEILNTRQLFIKYIEHFAEEVCLIDVKVELDEGYSEWHSFRLIMKSVLEYFNSKYYPEIARIDANPYVRSEYYQILYKIIFNGFKTPLPPLPYRFVRKMVIYQRYFKSYDSSIFSFTENEIMEFLKMKYGIDRETLTVLNMDVFTLNIDVLTIFSRHSVKDVNGSYQFKSHDFIFYRKEFLKIWEFFQFFRRKLLKWERENFSITNLNQSVCDFALVVPEFLYVAAVDLHSILIFSHYEPSGKARYYFLKFSDSQLFKYACIFLYGDIRKYFESFKNHFSPELIQSILEKMNLSNDMNIEFKTEQVPILRLRDNHDLAEVMLSYLGEI